MKHETKNIDELVQSFMAAIRTDEKFERFFEDYSSSSVNSFVNTYAHRKAMRTVYGPTFKESLDSMEIQWENEAMERLEEIQQVKLFLFQCNFRAGAIEEPVEGVRTIFDFLYWKENILNARFLEPISEEDISLYSTYLMSPHVNHNPFVFIEDWQDFEAIREAYNDEEGADRNVPEWYAYYFSHTGHGVELTLPDIKREKDIFYFLAGNKERTHQLQEAERKRLEENPDAAPDRRQYFNEYADNNLGRFMNLFEDKDNREMHDVWNAWCIYNEKEELLRSDLDMLMYANENIPIEYNENWIDGIQITAARYRSYKIGESLPAAYGQYKINLDLDISFPEKENSRKQADFYNDLILLGRKLNGEPEDFEY